ncbi:MAG: class I SAM-dependent rRNA methyltransferase [Anaerolineae bacterium]|nr:class I SAM-dependent rRNA methyltransferase [Anaerolineae bacterium]
MDRPALILKPDRDKPVRNRHPWVFSGAVARVAGDPADGDLVTVCSAGGEPLAVGYWNSRSQIRARLLTWDPEAPVDDAFWRSRLARALSTRGALAQDAATTAYRLVNAENDGVPGLIADRYGDWVVVQALTLGIDLRKALLAQVLADLLEEAGVPAGVYERSDVDVRRKEGLEPTTGVLVGAEPPERVEVRENGHRFLVDVRAGQKTGFYLDQRENRALLGEVLRADPDAPNKTVLNGFAYTGGFAVYALRGGAGRVVNVDSAPDALRLARENVALNGFPARDEDFIEANVFGALRAFRAEGRTFDVIVLDPPKFAHTARDVDAAARGYKDINLLAFQLLKPGGLLMTFSCSGLVSADLFQKVVFGALADSGREAQILRHLGPGADHPVALTFPEGAYLKGLLCRVW